jgi:hypothetical protein
MENFSTLADYTRAMKAFVRGVIKSKLFIGEDGELKVAYAKCNETGNVVCVTVSNGAYKANFTAEVATRTFNKVTDEYFDRALTQFKSIKGITKITVVAE